MFKPGQPQLTDAYVRHGLPLDVTPRELSKNC